MTIDPSKLSCKNYAEWQLPQVVLVAAGLVGDWTLHCLPVLRMVFAAKSWAIVHSKGRQSFDLRLTGTTWVGYIAGSWEVFRI